MTRFDRYSTDGITPPMPRRADPQALRRGVFWAITITLIAAAFFGGAVLRFGLGGA